MFAVRRRALPLLACLLVALAAFTLGYVGNEDFGWYLASGDVILARGAIPERDPFLYTSAQQSTWVTSGAHATHLGDALLAAGPSCSRGSPALRSPGHRRLLDALCVASLAVLSSPARGSTASVW